MSTVTSPLGSSESALLSNLRSQLAESVVQAEDAGEDMQRVRIMPFQPSLIGSQMLADARRRHRDVQQHFNRRVKSLEAQLREVRFNTQQLCPHLSFVPIRRSRSHTSSWSRDARDQTTRANGSKL